MSAMNFFGRLLNLNKKGQLFNALLHRTGDAVSEITEEAQIGYSDTSRRVVYFDGMAVREIVDKSYVDALAAAGTAPPLPFDASTEVNFPSTNAKYVVTVAGTVDGVSLEVQDQLFPNTATPTSDPSDWWVLQGNLDKATQAEVDGGTDDNKYLTALKVANTYLSKMGNSEIGGDAGNATFATKVYNGLVRNLKFLQDRIQMAVSDTNGMRALVQSLFISGQPTVSMYAINSLSQGTSFVMDSSTASIGNNLNGFAGISYHDDYSANFTDRSLVDKGYVSTQISSANKKYKATYTSFPMGSTEMVMHNLNLADATDCVVQAWVGSEPANVEIVAIDGNSFTMRSEMPLNNLKVVVLGL